MLKCLGWNHVLFGTLDMSESAHREPWSRVRDRGWTIFFVLPLKVPCGFEISQGKQDGESYVIQNSGTSSECRLYQVSLVQVKLLSSLCLSSPACSDWLQPRCSGSLWDLAASCSGTRIKWSIANRTPDSWIKPLISQAKTDSIASRTFSKARL